MALSEGEASSDDDQALQHRRTHPSEKYLKEQSEDEIDRQVKAIVRFALCAETKRTNIKKDDLVKRVDNSRAFQAIFERAQERLRMLFGVELVNLPVRERKTGPKDGLSSQSSKSNSYVLRSVLPPEETEDMAIATSELSYTVLLCVTLSVICASGQTMPEESLRKYLKKFEGSLEESYGSVLDLIELFVKEGYLGKVKGQRVGSEFESFDVFWGPRAKVEFGGDSLISFLTEVFPQLSVDAIKIAVQRATA
ncbi:hypothetical protein HDU67_002922 [Dinochytrium kinnereticum]|nr:hypothetical protein HDU67_002922 [Dinochytrium kinnereticum]